MTEARMPLWFRDLTWSPPASMEDLREGRPLVPYGPGVYLFTKDPEPHLPPTDTVWVGKTWSLRTRIRAYLGDPNAVVLMSRRHPEEFTTSLRYPGKAQLLFETMRSGGQLLWARWAEYTRPALIEGSLIRYLHPSHNTASVLAVLRDDDSLP